MPYSILHPLVARARCPAFRCAAACALALLALPACPGQVGRDAIDVQNARARFLESKRKTHPNQYSRVFDLSGLPDYVPAEKVAGAIRIWGLNYITDSNLAAYWEAGFAKFQPGARLEWHTPTALVAIPGLITGLADIGADRPITFDELLTFTRVFGHAPLEIPMATGSYNVQGWAPALTIFVNKDNPLTKLTLAQLDGILGAERDGGYVGLEWHPEVARGPEKNIRTWGQLGLTGEWANHPINFYGGGHRRHEQFVLEQKVLHGGTKWNERMHEYSNYVRSDGVMVVALTQQVEDLSRDRYGIGYNSMAQVTPGVKPIAIGETPAGPFFTPTLETIQNRTYPLISQEFFYLNRDADHPLEPRVKEFVRYVLSRQGQEAVMRDGRFLPLTAEVVRAALEKLQ
jgi:phosphate transport system substrate-binding protein